MYSFDLPWMPLRSDHRHQSEMISSILFGDLFEELETSGSWRKIRCQHDGYEGWLERIEPFQSIDLPDVSQTTLVLNGVLTNNNRPIASLPIGSRLHYHAEGLLLPKGHTYVGTEQDKSLSLNEVLGLAERMLGVPYLWGGVSDFGTDCSGFMQTIFRFAGIALKRDAYQQAEQGIEVGFGEHKPGDLAFFANDQGRISHVGLIQGEQRIIHASEMVREDAFRESGIYRIKSGLKTHSLQSIRRITA